MAAPKRGWSSLNTLIDNVAATAKAAAGLLSKNYITQIVVQNKHATVATTLAIRSGTVEIFKINLPAVQVAPQVITFAQPIYGADNTAIQIICGTTGSDVLVNLIGFEGM